MCTGSYYEEEVVWMTRHTVTLVSSPCNIYDMAAAAAVTISGTMTQIYFNQAT